MQPLRMHAWRNLRLFPWPEGASATAGTWRALPTASNVRLVERGNRTTAAAHGVARCSIFARRSSNAFMSSAGERCDFDPLDAVQLSDRVVQQPATMMHLGLRPPVLPSVLGRCFFT